MAIGLAVLTVIEVAIPEWTPLATFLGKTNIITLLILLALAKAGMVGMYYMHLKGETKFMKWTVAFPMIFPALYAFILIAEGIYRAVWGMG